MSDQTPVPQASDQGAGPEPGADQAASDTEAATAAAAAADQAAQVQAAADAAEAEKTAAVEAAAAATAEAPATKATPAPAEQVKAAIDKLVADWKEQLVPGQELDVDALVDRAIDIADKEIRGAEASPLADDVRQGLQDAVAASAKAQGFRFDLPIIARHIVQHIQRELAKLAADAESEATAIAKGL